MDTQWRHKSNISEKLGRCGRQNMLLPYLKIWDSDVTLTPPVGCKQPDFLSNFSRIQLIQNSAPSVARRRQCDIRIGIEFSAVQWRLFPPWASVVHAEIHKADKKCRTAHSDTWYLFNHELFYGGQFLCTFFSKSLIFQMK